MLADYDEASADRKLDESFKYDELKVIFDRYIKGLLKTQTRFERTEGGCATVCRSLDETFWWPKNEGVFNINRNEEPVDSFASDSYPNCVQHSETNMQDLNPALTSHNWEEADARIVLHAIDVTCRNLFWVYFILFTQWYFINFTALLW